MSMPWVSFWRKQGAELESAIKETQQVLQNIAAVPYEGEEKEPSLEEQEYYYRKYILKDPAFQW